MKEEIEKQWKDRVQSLGYKPGTAMYRKVECEFFVGAMAAIQAMDPDATPGKLSAKVPPIWPINIMSGRPVCGE